MKIFLTGGTGFIGKALLEALVEKGYFVRALARNETQKKELEGLGAEVVLGSLENAKMELLGGMEAVFHLAAIRYEWGHLPEDYEKVNVEATKNLLKATKEAGVKKFIFGSSVFVFGYPKKLPIDETFPYAPTTQYARSKMEAEKIGKFEMDTIILRPTITYGPGDTKGMLLKLAKLIKSKKFAIIGNGENFLHLTHIDDIIRGFLNALQTKGASGDFILASPKGITQKELAALVAKELDAEISRLKIPCWLAKSAGLANEIIYGLGMRLGIRYFFREPFISRSKVDIIARSQRYETSKAQKILGFEARISFPEGVKEAIVWYKKNGYL